MRTSNLCLFKVYCIIWEKCQQLNPEEHSLILFIFIWKTWILSFSIFILAKVSNLDTHKHGNKEFNKLSLYTCTLVIWKKLVINQNFNKKRRFYCIDMKADRCTLWIRTMNISIIFLQILQISIQNHLLIKV